MLRVALTGGIATGKSHVLNELRQRGVPCLDADQLAHGVTAAGTVATQAIRERFGPDVIDAAGAVDRRKLGAIVFADEQARRDLEAIVHPGVRRAIAAGLRALELSERPALAVVDIPLLYEAGRASDFDRVVATVCSRDRQIARLIDRGMSESEAEQRLAAQLPADAKAERADFVIRTDGSFAETAAQVDTIVAALRKMAATY